MTRLRSQTSIECAAPEVESRLGKFFESRRGANGVARMRLRVPILRSSGGPSFALKREVRVTARRIRDDPSLGDPIRITWEPEGRTVLPTFEGTLIVRGEKNDPRSYIELDGQYKPPLDGAGVIFDEAIGHRIAESTAREFLADLKRAVENS